MVNDIKQLNKKSVELVKYADDINLEVNVTKNDDSSESEITNIMEWAVNNKMEISTTKTKEILVRGKKQIILPPLIKGIERVPIMKSLGMYFSENPENWDKQFKVMLTKANSRFQILRICKYNGYNPLELDHLFKSLILSVITYGIQVWGAANHTYITQVDKLLKRAYKSGFSRTLITADSLIEQYDSNLWKKVENNNKSQLKDLLPPQRTRQLRARKHNFILPKVNTERFKRSFINRCLF